MIYLTFFINNSKSVKLSYCNSFNVCYSRKSRFSRIKGLYLRSRSTSIKFYRVIFYQLGENIGNITIYWTSDSQSYSNRLTNLIIKDILE
jgi:hypothetical protein